MFEGLGLRVQDLDFGGGAILLRDGKGRKDRVTMLPGVIEQPLQEHLEGVRRQHEADLKGGLGRAPRSNALIRKHPNADREWGWQRGGRGVRSPLDRLRKAVGKEKSVGLKILCVRPTSRGGASWS